MYLKESVMFVTHTSIWYRCVCMFYYMLHCSVIKYSWFGWSVGLNIACGLENLWSIRIIGNVFFLFKFPPLQTFMRLTTPISLHLLATLVYTKHTHTHTNDLIECCGILAKMVSKFMDVTFSRWSSLTCPYSLLFVDQCNTQWFIFFLFLLPFCF